MTLPATTIPYSTGAGLGDGLASEPQKAPDHVALALVDARDANAARYEFLRSHSLRWAWCEVPPGDTAEEIDAAIDASMAEMAAFTARFAPTKADIECKRDEVDASPRAALAPPK